jgi:hypothetical protein
LSTPSDIFDEAAARLRGLRRALPRPVELEPGAVFPLDLCSLFVPNAARIRPTQAAVGTRFGCTTEGASVTSIERDPATQEATANSGKSDRFLWGFPLFALCSAIVLTISFYLESLGGVWFTLAGGVLFFLVVSATLVMGAVGFFDVVRGRFKSAASLLLAPLIVASPFVFPIWPFEFRALDLMRLYLNKGYYDAVIEKIPPAERASKVVFFDWGVTGFLDAASYYSLVYDESGQIALPDEERSQAWKDRVYPEHRLLDEYCVTSADHLSGYFYSVVQHCSGDRIRTHWNVEGGRFVAPR